MVIPSFNFMSSHGCQVFFKKNPSLFLVQYDYLLLQPQPSFLNQCISKENNERTSTDLINKEFKKYNTINDNQYIFIEIEPVR